MCTPWTQFILTSVGPLLQGLQPITWQAPQHPFIMQQRCTGRFQPQSTLKQRSNGTHTSVDIPHDLYRTWIPALDGRRSRRCSTPSSHSSASQVPSNRSLPSRSVGGPCMGTMGREGHPPMSHLYHPCTTPPWLPCLPPPQNSMHRRMQQQWLHCR